MATTFKLGKLKSAKADFGVLEALDAAAAKATADGEGLSFVTIGKAALPRLFGKTAEQLEKDGEDPIEIAKICIAAMKWHSDMYKENVDAKQPPLDAKQPAE